jgi:segregation and condensation protein A
MIDRAAASSYMIEQPAFSGPLDMLLRLIERRELDITVVSLAQIADEYLVLVRQMDDPDPHALSEFLVLAARLLLIKSRALLPQPREPLSRLAEAEDGEALARQLREYQRYKQAAAVLRMWYEQSRRCYVRTAPPPVFEAPTARQLEATVADLLRAVQRRLQLRLPLDEPLLPLPAPKLLTVAELSERIRERLSRQAWVDFVDLLDLDADRVAVLVTFWATLELLKRREIVVEQSELFGAIMIGRGPGFGANEPSDAAAQFSTGRP